MIDGNVWFEILSDLFVNLAAGWLGVVVVILPVTRLKRKIDWFGLTMNIVLATVSLVIAYKLRQNI